MHAASLNAAEGVSAAATAAARAARTDAMEKEATTAKASAAAVAAAKEAALQEVCDVSTLAAALRDRAEESERVARGHRDRRAVQLVRCEMSLRGASTLYSLRAGTARAATCCSVFVLSGRSLRRIACRYSQLV